MRINKILAASGKFARREVDALIEAGQVMVNGKKSRTWPANSQKR